MKNFTSPKREGKPFSVLPKLEKVSQIPVDFDWYGEVKHISST